MTFTTFQKNEEACPFQVPYVNVRRNNNRITAIPGRKAQLNIFIPLESFDEHGQKSDGFKTATLIPILQNFRWIVLATFLST